MKIVAGNQEIQIKGIYGAPAHFNGVLVDSLKVSLPGDITQEQLSAMLENPWEIYDDHDVLQSVQEGLSFVEEYSLTFLKVTEQAKLQASLEDAQEKATLYKNALKDAGVDTDGETFRTMRQKAQSGRLDPS